MYNYYIHLLLSRFILLFVSPPSPSAPTNPSQAPVSPAEVQVLLSRLREHVNRKRLRPTDYFCDADPLRSGTVTVYRFRQVRGVNQSLVEHNNYI